MAGADHIQILNDGIKQLKEDRINGARVLATNALQTLRAITLNSSDTISTPEELWDLLRLASYKLILARPSMSAAVTSALVNCLQAVQESASRESSEEPNASIALPVHKEAVANTICEQIKKRNESMSRLSKAFVEYLRHLLTKKTRVHILTLSSSSTIFACLEQAVNELAGLSMTITVLESRPRMEGATFAVNFLSKMKSRGKGNNIEVVVAPDSHVCTVAKSIDMLLLGADRISSAGDVCNKMGSFPAAMAAKTLSKADVVVITETDKIARPGVTEAHGHENNDSREVYSGWPEDTIAVMKSLSKSDFDVRNIYFEWIPSEYVSMYVTERGILDAHAIKRMSEERAVMEDELFSNSIKESAMLE
ncbi:uncharacterized protein PV09_04870 [Verruconis gallopava]|uniref:EIF-2B GDP-GTP exchange factor subunit alpha n=1 Tax=Verruconis gallopava TaxID=253628 RepID=A0A0D1XNA0_9PEZI|nr:uncharacterized protein PV09_04870 [Verruconis gallopava]KIW04051.1 hypothetical protein PV09_04870 [Verruconis gallopava]